MTAVSVSNAPRWLQPVGPGVRTLPAGEWWDAVRVPLALGVRTLEELGNATGAVIEDSYGTTLYWLIPPGSATDWNVPPAQILGSGCHLAVPPPHRTRAPGLHWRVVPTRTRHWTNPTTLHRALRTALS